MCFSPLWKDLTYFFHISLSHYMKNNLQLDLVKPVTSLISKVMGTENWPSGHVALTSGKTRQ